MLEQLDPLLRFNFVELYQVLQQQSWINAGVNTLTGPVTTTFKNGMEPVQWALGRQNDAENIAWARACLLLHQRPCLMGRETDTSAPGTVETHRYYYVPFRELKLYLMTHAHAHSRYSGSRFVLQSCVIIIKLSPRPCTTLLASRRNFYVFVCCSYKFITFLEGTLRGCWLVTVAVDAGCCCIYYS